MQVREVNSGPAKQEAREKLLEAARRREIDVVLVAARPLGDIRVFIGLLASVRTVGTGARDNLLADLPAQRQPDTDIKLRVNKRVEG